MGDTSSVHDFTFSGLLVVSVVGFCCIYLLAQITKRRRWSLSKRAEDQPHFGSAFILMAAAFGAFSMFSYQAFKESSVNYDIGNPSVRTFGLRVIPARFTVETRNLFV